MTTKLQKPKYSILIPTRNRAFYLPFSIESVLSTTRRDIELIVSNNHSSDNTSAYLSSISDPRLKVISPNEELPMSLHYEFALSHAKGEWVTIIGDDDAIMPYLFERLDSLINKYPKNSIISSRRAYYFWEGCEDLYGDSVVSYVRESKVSLRSTKYDFLAALAGLRSCFDLPQIYTSCVVKNSLINSIKNDSGGRFYHSIIPDMYSAVALCLKEKLYLRVKEPLFWTGTSNSSMGRSDRIYKDSEIKSMSSSNEHLKIKLHEDIPQNLHILGFGSLYLYEGLLNCPLKSKFFSSSIICSLVYADLIRKIDTKSKNRFLDKSLAKENWLIQIHSQGLSILKIQFICFLIKIFSVFTTFFKFPSRVYLKIRRQLKKDFLISNDKKRFNTILKASKEIESIIAKF